MNEEKEVSKIKLNSGIPIISLVILVFGVGGGYTANKMETKNIRENYAKKTEIVQIREQVLRVNEKIEDIKLEINKSNSKNEKKYSKILDILITMKIGSEK